MDKINWQTLIIRHLRAGEEIPFELLQLADPSRTLIEAYLPNAELYLADWEGQTIGAYVLCPLDWRRAEIKNIAVTEAWQGKGLGQILLKHAEEMARAKGFDTLLIGTANSSIGQLYLYQKMEFELLEIRKGFFLEHYKGELWENGLRVRDLVVLGKGLRQRDENTDGAY